VYQATHIPTGELVAIKVLKKKHIKDVIDIERVSRELYILKTVQHSNLIGLYEIIETKSTIYIVLQSCKEELFDLIVRNKRLPEQLAVNIFSQLISGVQYMHEKLQIVHRDIKPENLLLTDSGQLKIIDFGLSNTICNQTEHLSTACGSPCYAAPEMLLCADKQRD
jgi:5'-AMP-activated protein kinase catalytic alpha subunit